ncbi:MAG: hypothetical protein PCFJNLEI_00735 [Verrucomicrobiae bacterium]|nr:hypothetical protein [Verrucomicrobiae bacterium]
MSPNAMLAGMSTKAYRRWRAVLLLVVIFAAYRLTLHWMVEAKLNAISAQGLPVTLAELNQWYPTPPPGENAATLYSNAWANIAQPSANAREALPMPVGQASGPKRGEALSPETKAATAAYLAGNKHALELLHQAVAGAPCRYPIDLRNWFSSDPDHFYDHLTALRQAAKLLELESIYRVNDGDLPAAVKSLTALLTLAQSLDNEPGNIACLVQAEARRRAVDGIEYLASRTQFSSGQVEEFASELSEADRIEVLVHAVISQRCIGCEAFATDPCIYMEIVQNLTHVTRLSRSQLPLPYSIAYTIYSVAGLLAVDQLVFLKKCETYLDRIQSSSSQVIELGRWEQLPSYNYFTRLLISDLNQMTTRFLDTQARLRIARTALAIERRRGGNADVPKGLNELVPDILNAIPNDTFTNQPLRYKELAKGYVVYSVGEDGKDDGGDDKKDITFTVER